MKKLYTIGEVSELNGISSRTLRHYDMIGLLVPGHKDPDTQYRFYTKEQVLDVFLIKKLKGLGFTLKEIASLITSDSPQRCTDEISVKMKALRKEIARLEQTYVEGMALLDKMAMHNSVHCIEDDASDGRISTEPRVEHIPEVDVLFTKHRQNDYNNAEITVSKWLDMFKRAEERDLPISGSLTTMYHTENPMEQFFKDTVDLEFMLPVDAAGASAPDIKRFGGFDAATLTHVGSHASISASHIKLLRWMEHCDLQVTGMISEEYIVSPLDIKTERGYLTRIIVPTASHE